MKLVVIFDSGIGGFGILRELSHGYHARFLYLADQANFPYGTRNTAWLQARLTQVAKWAAGFSPHALVIACNTATVTSIAEIRAEYPFPIFGVEPVVKPLASYQKALILATPATAQSPKTKKLLFEFGGRQRVLACNFLASAIETNDQKTLNSEIEKIKNLVKAENIEAIGLSCTHYGLIISELKHKLPGVDLIDPAPSVAAHIATSLKLAKITEDHPSVQFFTTGDVVNFTNQISRYFPELSGSKPAMAII